MWAKTDSKVRKADLEVLQPNISDRVSLVREELIIERILRSFLRQVAISVGIVPLAVVSSGMEPSMKPCTSKHKRIVSS